MKGPTRMAREPRQDLGVFMGSVVIQNDMDDLACRNFPRLLSLPAPGAETVDALPLHPDHSMGADYSSRSATTPCAKSV